MLRSIIAFLLAAWTSAFAQDKPLAWTTVTAEASGYRVGERTVQSPLEVVAGLRAIPKLEAVGVEAAPGVPQQRVDALIAAIRHSGLELRIGVVGNEVFTR